MPVTPLTPDKLCLVCDAHQFGFETTADLPARTTIIGQPRGTRAIEFGMGIQSEGYNIYALGQMGTGRATALQHFLQSRAAEMARPSDWLYVHNFQMPHQPRVLRLAAGDGKLFQERMGRLLADLQNDLPRAFDTDSYREAVREARVQFERQRDGLLEGMQVEAAKVGFALLSTPSGLVAGPVREGQPLTLQEAQQMTLAQRQMLEQEQSRLNEALDEVLDEVRQREGEARAQVEQVDRQVAAAAIKHCFTLMRGMYAEETAVLTYLDDLHDDVLNQLEAFVPTDEEDGQTADLRRYEVNLLVNNAETQGAPVIFEMNPTYYNLFGRIEYEMMAGMATTHFSNIKCGALHWANGGFLLLYAADLMKYPDAWDALKRALKSAQILVQQPNMFNDNAPVLAKSLSPEPIPLQVKIVLLGNPELYYTLHVRDEEFAELFKVRADFDSRMPRTPESEVAYAEFVATRCHEEKLLHFEKTAVAKVVEYGARLAEEQAYLSTKFGAIADLVREASFWAQRNGRSLVTAADVRQAIAERIERNNHVEKRIQESILKNSIFIATEGSVVGQVNGLTIIDLGDYAFGQPGRITARTFMGEDGVVHIERQTEMSGPLHDKGLLTLMGYLGGTYARNQPLSLSASLTFEQNYGGIDGDSASSTELYALLSSLSNLPIQQGIGVTGSVNQRGEVQPIGGVNEKVEGFFKICAARGLTGEQGVLIPASNVDELMLDEAVVTAVSAGQFSIWPIKTVDEGIEMLMGVAAGERDENEAYPKGTVHRMVQDQLLKLALDLKSFGHDDDDDEEDEELTKEG